MSIGKYAAPIFNVAMIETIASSDLSRYKATVSWGFTSHFFK